MTIQPQNVPQSLSLTHQEAIDNPVQVQKARSAPVASFKTLVAVNADVLDLVVKFAAISCQLTMPDRGSMEDHEMNLYKMLVKMDTTDEGESKGIQTSISVDSTTVSVTSVPKSNPTSKRDVQYCHGQS